MKRRTFLQTTAAAAATAFGARRTGAAAGKRPNILWITCEDMSAQLGCYGDTEATTPTLDGLAAQGVRYDRAFSICGVCAPSRSCLITGMYPPSIGTHHMRCRNAPPDHVRCFPEYLQEAGYYCTNNVKTDYNFNPPPTAWNDSSRTAHWRNRPQADQPFFSVFNFTITHESMIGTLRDDMGDGPRSLLSEQRHDPANANLPPYYPDTPVIRKHWAHYYDLVTAMDAQVGQVLSELEEDDLADNTIVFWFSDHGAGLPRAKRWLYDAGLHVPMIVRWPGVIEPDSVNGDLVSFVDFAPTVLSLADVAPPSHMQGQVILGEHAAPPREYVYGMRDRMDERYDHIRAVRDKRYKYIRNYEPWRAYDQPLRYPESFPVMQEMRRVQSAGKLTPEQALFFRQEKPLEELYDTESDPHELNNIVDDPAHADRLDAFRNALNEWEITTGDLGPIPEFALANRLAGMYGVVERPIPSTVEVTGDQGLFGRTNYELLVEVHHRHDERRRIAAAKAMCAASLDFTFWGDADPLVEYWGLISLARSRQSIDGDTWRKIEGYLNSEKIAHQLGAAAVYIAHDRAEEAMPVIRKLLAHQNEFTRLYAAQLLEPIAESHPAAREALQTMSDDSSTYVRHTVERVLSRIGTP